MSPPGSGGFLAAALPNENRTKVLKMAHNVRRDSGFTLIELIVAFTILGLVAGIVFSSFRLALNSYQKSQTRLEEEAVERILGDQVKRQVASLYPLRPVAPPDRTGLGPVEPPTRFQTPLFFGTPDSVTFITVAPLIMHQTPGLTVVRYGLAEDEYGDPYMGSMETQFVGLDSFNAMVRIPDGKPLPLIRDITALEFQYYGYDPRQKAFAWFPEWLGEEMQSVPRAIRIVHNRGEVFASVNASFIGRRTRSNRVFGTAADRK